MNVGRRRAHGTVFDRELVSEMLYTDENLNLSGQRTLSHAALFLHEDGKRISGHDVVLMLELELTPLVLLAREFTSDPRSFVLHRVSVGYPAAIYFGNLVCAQIPRRGSGGTYWGGATWRHRSTS